MSTKIIKRNGRGNKALSEKVIGGVELGASVLLADLGSNAGLYDALASGGQQTASELAARTGLVERYVSDWLANQLAAGFVSLVRPAQEPPRFFLSDAQKIVFVSKESPNSLLLYTHMMTAITHNIVNRLPRDFKEGKGIPFGENHPVIFSALALEPTAFPPELAMQPLLASLPPVLKDRFTPGGPPPTNGGVGPLVVLDLACGQGAVLRYFAKQFPANLYIGIDMSEASLQMARQQAVGEGLSPLNPLFHCADAHSILQLDKIPKIAEAWKSVAAQSGAAAAVSAPNKVHVVIMKDALHDLADPLAALVALRAILADDGVVYAIEPGTKPFTWDSLAGPMDASFAAASVSICGPSGMAGRADGQPCSSVHLGTIAPDAAYFELAKKAGFNDVSKAAGRVYKLML